MLEFEERGMALELSLTDSSVGDKEVERCATGD
jgi:hypothetical protein